MATVLMICRYVIASVASTKENPESLLFLVTKQKRNLKFSLLKLLRAALNGKGDKLMLCFQIVFRTLKSDFHAW